MEILSDDDDFIIPKGEGGVITREGMTDVELIIPELPEDKQIPDMMLYLTACAMRVHLEPEFVQEMINWFKSVKPN